MANRVSAYRHAVTLWRKPKTSGDADGYEEALTPSAWWAAIIPYQGQTDIRASISQIMLRYHPQVDVDTIVRKTTVTSWSFGIVASYPGAPPRLAVHRDRRFNVLGVQDVEDRHLEQLLTCEEVWV
jgi:hypothetical protein